MALCLPASYIFILSVMFFGSGIAIIFDCHRKLIVKLHFWGQFLEQLESPLFNPENHYRWLLSNFSFLSVFKGNPFSVIHPALRLQKPYSTLQKWPLLLQNQKSED
jgi:hypothetical protein